MTGRPATIELLKRNVRSIHSEKLFDGFFPTRGCFMGSFSSLLTLLRCTSSEFTRLLVQFVGCILGTIRHYREDIPPSCHSLPPSALPQTFASRFLRLIGGVRCNVLGRFRCTFRSYKVEEEEEDKLQVSSTIVFH